MIGIYCPLEHRGTIIASISEVMTITIAFDGSGFRTFKEFYPLQVQPHWDGACPHLVSYTHFVELMHWSLMGPLSFFNTCGFD
jgi:hypothetical protein